MAIQKVLDSEELQKKLNPITMGFAIGCIVIGFYGGASYSKIQAQDEIQKLSQEHAEEMREIMHAFALDEVEGLRADVYREDKHLRDDIEELKKAISK